MIITLCILAYLAVGFILTTIHLANDNFDFRHSDGAEMAMGMFLWPFFLFHYLLAGIFTGLTNLSKLIITKIRERAQDDPV